MDQQKRVKDIKFAAWSIAGAFLTYFSMYAFRKPFSAGTYEGMVIWGMDYKIMLVTFQVAGYTLSKFMGIKLVSEMKPERRVVYILGQFGVSWRALFAFGL
ncbi:MAG: DUF5690 family protein, partial [Saprospiraceae bacterium]|nr:DUF5690 family protein [Saprospiraceae bacterium]